MKNDILRLPANHKLENVLLAKALYQSQLPLLLKLGVNEQYFAYEKNKEIFRAMLELYDIGDVVSLTTLYAYVQSRKNKYIQPTDVASLDIGDVVLDTVEIVEQLRKYHLKRIVMQNAYDLLVNAKGKSLQDIYKIMQSTLKVMTYDNLKPASELQVPVFCRYDTMPQIDELVCISPADLVIIAGRPSKGKSALLLSLALKMQEYFPTIFSLEMSEYAIRNRLIAMKLKKPLNHIINNPVYVDYRLDLNIIFDFTARISTADIYMKFNEAYQKYNSRLVMVDYLQLCTTTTEKRLQYTKNDYVGKISADLKAIAKDFNVPVIACSQLNRKSGDDKHVSLSDLRDSGEIEQNADIVIAIQNDGCIEVLKQRNGATGIIKDIKFHKDICLWQ